MTRTLTIIYATSTGHTEFVIDTVVAALKDVKDLRVVKQRAETTKPEDLTKNDLLLLACGSWNTGGPEGQMNPWMNDLLMNRASAVDLKGIHAAAIGLGDERYHFTARAADLLTTFLQDHHATLVLPALKIINDPFDQAEKVHAWVQEFTKKLNMKSSSAKK